MICDVYKGDGTPRDLPLPPADTDVFCSNTSIIFCSDASTISVILLEICVTKITGSQDCV